MRKQLCKILTRGKHLFRLTDHRYRCIFCKALRYQVEPKPHPVIIHVPVVSPLVMADLVEKSTTIDTGTGLPPAAVEKYTNDTPATEN